MQAKCLILTAGALSLALTACGEQSQSPNAGVDEQSGQNATQSQSLGTQQGTTGEAPGAMAEQKPGATAGKAASAKLAATEGNEAAGSVSFEQGPTGVKVTGKITGLAAGKHGFHVHENGDCSAPDATSAGGHFNPEGVKHGAPDAGKHHVGDMGNIMANDQGIAIVDENFDFLSLEGDNSIIGKAVVVHGGADDLESQPSGAAGPRVACGVISAAAAGGATGDESMGANTANTPAAGANEHPGESEQASGQGGDEHPGDGQ